MLFHCEIASSLWSLINGLFKLARVMTHQVGDLFWSCKGKFESPKKIFAENNFASLNVVYLKRKE